MRHKQQGASRGSRPKKVKNCCWQQEGSSSGSRWASSRAKEGLEEQKTSSTMLIVLITIAFKVVWHRLTKLPIAAMLLVYFILLTCE